MNISKNTFFDDCLARLEKGAQEYGDESFYKPSGELVREIEEELLDVANWSSILAATCKSPPALRLLMRLSRTSQLMSDQLRLEVERGTFDDRSFPPSRDAGVMVGLATAFLDDTLEKK